MTPKKQRSHPRAWRPTKEQLESARALRVPDVIAPDLDVLFSGINPGLYSGAVKHHFARPGNRFWPALHRSGFTPHELSPFDERELLDLGLGITNIVNRTTARADELTADELRRGAANLKRKAKRYQPRVLAVLGISAYRNAFGVSKATFGLQTQRIHDTEVWVLPNPSGLNAHFQLDRLVESFSELRVHVTGP
jgi:double-stranded uracil-DNA glycosylase